MYIRIIFNATTLVPVQLLNMFPEFQFLSAHEATFGLCLMYDVYIIHCFIVIDCWIFLINSGKCHVL